MNQQFERLQVADSSQQPARRVIRIMDHNLVDPAKATPIRLPRELRTIKLDMTSTCNFACDYCFVEEGHALPGPKVMSQQTIERALAWFADQSLSGTSVVVLFGGEPLLNKLGVRTACREVTRLRASGRDVRLQVITNAVLATTEVCELLGRAEATVMVSIDGSREMHDSRRRDHSGGDTYTRVISGLINLQAVIPEQRIWARATMTQGTSQAKYFDELVSLGLKNISLGYVDDTPPEGMTVTAYMAEIDELFERAIGLAKAGTVVRLHPMHTYLSLVYGKLGRQKSWPQYDCGAATRIVSITPDGRIYPCEHAVIARKQIDWQIGSVATGIDSSLVASFLDLTSKTHAGCSSCGSKSMCDQGCRVDYTLARQQDGCHATEAFLFALWERVEHWYNRLAEDEPSVLMRMVDERLHASIRTH